MATLPEIKLDSSITVEEQMKLFQEIDKPNKSLHAYIARIIGPVAFNKLPVLNLGKNIGNTEYLDFVTVEMVSDPIMKGEDAAQRPFIVLRYRNNLDNKVRAITVFHRYTNEEIWCNGTCYPKDCFNDRLMTQVCKEYMTRLVKREHCGVLKYESTHDDIVDLIRTMPDGRSIIELV